MLLGRFLKSTSGGAAPFLALSLVPLMGFTGAAIDYSRGNAVKVAMQAALDSTGLILSKDAQNLSTGALASRIDSVFKAQFNRPEAHNVSVSYVFNAPQQGNFSLKLTGSATVPTHFATLIGTSELTVSATAEVIWGIKRLNLALALDNTGSMASSGKMTALKAAAHNLLNTLQAAAKKPDDVKVSIIPFATDVNVGTVYKNEFMDRLGAMGRRQRDMLEQQLQNQDRLQQCGQVMDRGKPQHLERLRMGSRPEL